MPVSESVLSLAQFGMCVGCLVTVCGLTFARGRPGFDPVRSFLPFRWLIDAALPATSGARFVAPAAAVRHSPHRTGSTERKAPRWNRWS